MFSLSARIALTILLFNVFTFPVYSIDDIVNPSATPVATATPAVTATPTPTGTATPTPTATSQTTASPTANATAVVTAKPTAKPVVATKKPSASPSSSVTPVPTSMPTTPPQPEVSATVKSVTTTASNVKGPGMFSGIVMFLIAVSSLGGGIFLLRKNPKIK